MKLLVISAIMGSIVGLLIEPTSVFIENTVKRSQSMAENERIASFDACMNYGFYIECRQYLGE